MLYLKVKANQMTLKNRPDRLDGITVKMNTGYGTLYCTVNESKGIPFEVFAVIGKPGTSIAAKTEAIGRLISLALRAGADIKDVINQLKGIEGENSIHVDGVLVRSIPDAIAQILEKLYVTEKTKEKGTGNAKSICSK